MRARPVLSASSPLLTLSVILVAGIGFGALARRLRLPSVTGQILAGILLGPAVLRVIELDAIRGLDPVIDFALGLMAVAVGSHLRYRHLRNARRRLALLLLFEATLTPLLAFAALRFAGGASMPMAVVLAAIAVSTAPATTLAIVRETRSKGVFVKTLLAGVALNNLACIVLFEVAHTAAAASLDPGTRGPLAVVVEPLLQVVTSAVLGVGIGALLVILTRGVVRTDRLTAASMVALFLTVGVAEQVPHASGLLSCLFLGIALANLTPYREEIGHAVFDNFEYAIFAVFFTVAGMELDFAQVPLGGLLALLFCLARAAGKIGASALAMRLARATRGMRRYLGFALLPQAGLAVGLMLLLTEDPTFAPMRDLFPAVVLSAVLAAELGGPILARFALSRSGDSGKDRARLIDFLHEEHITTDLRAETKEDAIRQLAGVLARTTPVRDAAGFTERVLAREREGSTCLGTGLAIPHATLDEGTGIVGVMGISREGLPFPTPDGMPVHCMVLLATPEAARDHHLEVLGAFARAIGRDPAVREQLFHAKSPAHAYELLHAEDAEDFNYFLED